SIPVNSFFHIKLNRCRQASPLDNGAFERVKSSTLFMGETLNSAGTDAFSDSDREGESLERRLLRGMIVSVVLAVLVSLIVAPWRVTTGLMLGGVLAFFNHHWLRTSLRAVFGGAAQAGRRPKLGAARYILRYFIIAAVVASAYMLDLVSIAATLAGMCAFAAAVMIEALTQLYFAIRYREEN
ncbi:MAG TPA: ATP synthase subunit I, partial [Pyrinomonadaceae bacterium]|nr:ATP synthase subunit I [Pyrinomonadaceae bacterium]